MWLVLVVFINLMCSFQRWHDTKYRTDSTWRGSCCAELLWSGVKANKQSRESTNEQTNTNNTKKWNERVGDMVTSCLFLTLTQSEWNTIYHSCWTCQLEFVLVIVVRWFIYWCLFFGLKLTRKLDRSRGRALKFWDDCATFWFHWRLCGLFLLLFVYFL